MWMMLTGVKITAAALPMGQLIGRNESASG
jgi:hypothetical protein